MYDSELAAGFQDADFEMAELTAAGNRASELEKRGICTHGWLFAPAFQPAKCNDCGKVGDADDLRREGRNRLLGLEDDN